MKRIAASLLAVGLLAAPVLAAETTSPATAPAAPATKAADTTKKAPDGATVAPAKTESKHLAMAKKPATHRRGHKRHATITKPKAVPPRRPSSASPRKPRGGGPRLHGAPEKM